MDGDNCTTQQIETFNALPQQRKAIITMDEHPNVPSAWAVADPKYKQAQILEYGLWNQTIRWYELMDYVHFFNTGKIRDNALFRLKKKNRKTA